jgi:hypothetical protein
VWSYVEASQSAEIYNISIADKSQRLEQNSRRKKNQLEDLQKHLPTKNQVLSCALNRNMHC